MTQQEQFEADYTAALPEMTQSEARRRWDSETPEFVRVKMLWLQQAKRHEAEVAELVAALKDLGTSINGDYYRGQDWERACISGLIAKYEVKKL